MNKRISLLGALFLFSCVLGNGLFAAEHGNHSHKRGCEIDVSWKYQVGNNSSWTSVDFDDSGWSSVNLPCVIPLNKNNYVYLRTTVTVPSDFKGQPLYLDAGHAYGAFDVYANGVFIGSNGRLPPDVNVRPKENSVILIPSNVIDQHGVEQEIHLTYVCWTNADVMEITERPVFMTRSQTKRITYLRDILSNTMYVIISVLCLAMGIFMSTQYFMNKEKGKTFLWFALSSITISFYFFDMGCKQILFDFILQREIARALLLVSMGFLLMFFHQFLDGKIKKRTLIYVVAIDIVSVLGHLILMHNWVLVSNFFTITLVPVMYVCIYGIVVSIKGLKDKSHNMTIVLVGFLIAVMLAFVDILAQVQGKAPFVWLQGYAFFILNLAVFLTLSLESVKNQQAVDRLAIQANEQNKILEDLFGKARDLSNDTTEIAGFLNTSVLKVNDVSETSINQVHGIEAALVQQNNQLQAADNAVDNLIKSLSETNENLESSAESIAFSAEQTAKLLEGFQSVGKSISGAAVLAQSLDELTVKNANDVNLLTEAMDEMKNRSDEILSIVQVLDNFSSRTNLLAMNASIEAAHAGAAGKGFAVVANEIKNLATQSSAQAQKISEIIGEIAMSISTGVGLADGVQKTLSEMRKEASDTASHVKSAAEEMNRQQSEGERIEAEARKISDAAEQMKKAAYEQFNYSDTVKNSMEQLRSATKAVDEAAGAIADASRILSENVSDLKNMSEKTRETSDRLSQMMKL
ncbi:MAG: methyl-accepting chemotaxis protein [Treponema sp.]|nr:methyl-accepting chemotaxis protein [Treponema sp.]